MYLIFYNYIGLYITMQKIFLDTEFTGLHQNTTLISLALVAETGEEFYAEFTDYNKECIDNYLEINVIANLSLKINEQSYTLQKMHIIGNKNEVKSALVIWLNQFEIKKDKNGNIISTLQFWADVPHYDWVLFCELFGGALKIPKQIHYICLDIATFLYSNGLNYTQVRNEIIEKTELPKDYKQHNALSDTRLIKMIFEKINN